VRALILVLAGVCLAMPTAAVPAAHDVSCCGIDGQRRIVQLTLRNQSRMTDADLGAVLAVATRIWAPYGIGVERGADPGAIAVVLISGRSLAPQDVSAPVLGTTLFAQGHALPFINLSLAAAEALADESDLGVIPFRAQSAERRNGILRRMLGVALAHEMGHYLLDTARHSPVGLLQAALSTRELAFPEASHLRLTPEQRRRLCPCSDAAPQ
jgi:hypothetical protein